MSFDWASDDDDLRASTDLETDERRESSGGPGVVEGVGVEGRELAIASTEEVRRMTPPIRERKDLGVLGLLMAGLAGLTFGLPGAGVEDNEGYQSVGEGAGSVLQARRRSRAF